uniref:Uncharacterized protein n=1 Tax=Spongospora subterranea TaxID=70186 RepID=A0A0H5QQP7_9EUKA|eukprot:CRZ04405.1 hypothetical protein [Spongospora subterranea]
MLYSKDQHLQQVDLSALSSCHKQNNVSKRSLSLSLSNPPSVFEISRRVVNHCSCSVEKLALCSHDLKLSPFIFFITCPALDADSTTVFGIPAMRATCIP